MSVIASSIQAARNEESARRSELSRHLAEDWKLITVDLRRVIAPVADEVKLEYLGGQPADDQRALRIATWRVCSKAARVRPFLLVYIRRGGWLLERRDENDRTLETATLVEYDNGGYWCAPELTPQWSSPEVGRFLAGLAEDEPAGDDAVWVLADGMPVGDDAPGGVFDGAVLVRLESRDTVAALHWVVGRIDHRQYVPVRPGLRIFSLTAELEAPQAKAWAVVDTPPPDIGRGLGDGLLLEAHELERVNRGKEIKSITLEVRDDGMLLVKSDGGWATIDLSALAEACR